MASNVSLASSGKPTVLGSLGMLFYLVDPRKTSFQTPEQVPNYFQQVSSSQYQSYLFVIYRSLTGRAERF